jgi:hypothetical protein
VTKRKATGGSKGRKSGSTGNKDYTVGYGKPPVSGRIKPGEVRNPKGRPKGSRSITAIARKLAGERIRIVRDGRSRSVTKLEAFMRTLEDMALKRELPAIKLYLDVLRVAGLIDPSIGDGGGSGGLSASETAALMNAFQRLGYDQEKRK